jgi:uncharacterized membrane protein
MRAPPLLARILEPLLTTLWPLFVVWSAVVATLWIAGEQWVPTIGDAGLRAAITLAVRGSDTVWLVLGAANLYLHVAQTEGLLRARLIGLSIGAAALAVAAGSVWKGYPLGAVFFTSRLGLKIGPVPLGWPLLWFITVVGGREVCARIFPRASHAQLAVATGVFAMLTDLNLEPIATKLRFFWFWYAPGTHLAGAASWHTYATWFLVGSALAWLIRDQRIGSARRASLRPAAVPLIVNGMLLLGHACSAWHR